MIIQHNLNLIQANNKLKANVTGVKKSSEKLSSGYRINRASDDAAGLAVSEKMRSQIHGLNVAVRNSQDGISLIQTFEGALGETVAIIQRMKSLAEESANGTYDNSIDRAAVEIEYINLCDEVNQIAETDFNGIVMLNGKPDSVNVAAEFESRINSAVESLPDTISEISPHTIASNAETQAFAASAATYTAPRAGGVACGDFTVYGNSSDYSFDTASGVLTILGGDVTVEGTGAATANTIVVAKDVSANVTLKNVNINLSRTIGCAFKIADDSLGDVTITLEGDNTLVSGSNCAGLQKNGKENTGTLTINGAGTLNAYGGASGAGIGSSIGKTTSNIKIVSGNITAKSVDSNLGGDGAGIGGGYKGNAANITILGGNITAISDYGSGIGAGWSHSSYGNTTGGNASGIYIFGGTVVAECRRGGANCAGIGGDNYVSDIVIDGGKINAKGDTGIGGGRRGITNITINSGDIIAKGITGAGIGSGGGTYGGDVEIVINGGKIDSESRDGAGIGGGYAQAAMNIIINGGTINSISSGCSGAAGIGAGGCNDYAFSHGGNVDSSVRITGGYVTAISKYVKNNAAEEIGVGIGGGAYGKGTVTISGKKTVVIAKGGEHNGKSAADIGSGTNASVANVMINDGLISEPYTSGEIVDGTIVHYKNNTNPTNHEKLIVSTRPGKGKAKLTYTDELVLQTGARTKDSVNFTFSYSTNGIGDLNADLNCTAAGLGLDALTLKTQKSANFAVDRLDHALNKVSMIRSTFGAAQNRLEHKIDNLNNTTENLTEAESTLRDTDMASEMMNYTKHNILQQAAQSILAQAKQLPQGTLQMLE